PLGPAPAGPAIRTCPPSFPYSRATARREAAGAARRARGRREAMGSTGLCALVLGSWLASGVGVQQQRRGHGGGWLRDDQPEPWVARQGTQAKLGVPGWSALAPTERGCYSWMNNTCVQRLRGDSLLNSSAWWHFEARGSTSKKACNDRVQSFDAQCVDGRASMLWVVGKEPALPQSPGCHVWHPYGCPLMDPDTTKAQEKMPQDFESWVLKEGSSSTSRESCQKHKARVDDECGATTMAVWVAKDGSVFRDGHLEFDDEMPTRRPGRPSTTRCAPARSAGSPSAAAPTWQRWTPPPHDKFSGLSWGETISGRLTADGKWLHVKDVGFLPVELDGFRVLEKQEAPCGDAKPGDACYQTVHWARTVGLPGHPDWYPGLTVDSSVREFQEVLHQNGKCPMPCP
ncbi:unnamed protein product, partial [Prorocentrum cordatum]